MEKPPLDLWRDGAKAFNAGSYWEAHTFWEDLWNQTSGSEKLCVQSLIQVCGILVHLEKGRIEPALKLARRCQAKIKDEIDMPYKINGLEDFLLTLFELSSETSWNNKVIQVKIQKLHAPLQRILP